MYVASRLFSAAWQGEIIARMAHQERQLLIAPFIFQFHRRYENSLCLRAGAGWK